MGETTILIQARTGSTRLPNKMVLPFWQNKSLFEIVILNLKKLNSRIILATTENNSDDILCEIAQKYGIETFRGSEDNVLSRFIGACEKYDLDKIIRVCADNPFLDVPSLNLLIEKANLTKSFDYIAYKVNEKPSIITHFGFWAEATRLGTLKRISQLSTDKVHLEHLTNYIYTHTQDFNIIYLEVEQDISLKNDVRLTIDTQIDFNIQKMLFNKLIEKYDWSFSINDVFCILKEYPELSILMKNEIIKNEK